MTPASGCGPLVGLGDPRAVERRQLPTRAWRRRAARARPPGRRRSRRRSAAGRRARSSPSAGPFAGSPRPRGRRRSAPEPRPRHVRVPPRQQVWQRSGDDPSVAQELIEIETARAMVLERAPRLPSEPVPLREAHGRVLAEPVVAVDDVPGFDNSAMDGFAVLAADSQGASGDAPRGLGWSTSRAPAIPRSARAVARRGDRDLHRRGRPGRRRRGGPRRGHPPRRRRGQPDGGGRRRDGTSAARARTSGPASAVLDGGIALGAAELGVLASVGHAEVVVRPPPASWPCCSPATSWSSPERRSGPGQIRDSNAYSVPPLAEAAGAELRLGRDRRRRSRGDPRGAGAGAGGRRGRRLRRRLGRRARPRPPGARGARRRAGLLGRLAAAREADLLRGRPGRDAGLRPARQSRSRRWSPSCSSSGRRCGSCRAPIRPGRRVTARFDRRLPKVEGRAEAIRVGLEAGERGWSATPTGPAGLARAHLDARRRRPRLRPDRARRRPGRGADRGRAAALRRESAQRARAFASPERRSGLPGPSRSRRQRSRRRFASSRLERAVRPPRARIPRRGSRR